MNVLTSSSIDFIPFVNICKSIYQKHPLKNLSSEGIRNFFNDCVKNQITEKFLKKEKSLDLPTIKINDVAQDTLNPKIIAIAPTSKISATAFAEQTQLLNTIKEIPKESIDISNLISTEQSLSSFTSSLVSNTLKNPKFFLMGIPFFLFLLYSGKEKQALDIDLNITASAEKKVYRVILGKNNVSISTSFEVAAGHPIRLLRKANAKYQTESMNFNQPVFESPAISEWKRKKNYTILNINVKEPAHSTFLKKPVTFSLPISATEFIRIHHLPHQPDKGKPFKKNLKLEDGRDWIRRKIMIDLPSTKVAVKKPYHIPLPSIKYPKGYFFGTEYLRVEQLK